MKDHMATVRVTHVCSTRPDDGSGDVYSRQWCTLIGFRPLTHGDATQLCKGGHQSSCDPQPVPAV
eukprot:39449-Prymnesium_polylepis.1